ncbi:MAG: TIGR04211 family SH3 domain-containing protein [Kangiella sp.]|jgi:SH3 domain protein|nr:TIGR04211 family SH3 domain-containing protein [Kangiella sp.]MCW9027561.1 TIGR04211 family SH3 domain-containing protein [Kangiella sp.]
MFRLLLVFLLLTTTQFAQAADPAQNTDTQSQYYVSDEIGVIMRSGPTNRYRVTGRLVAGTPIEVLASDTANDSSQVRAANGDEGWIQTEYITNQPTVRALHAELQVEHEALQQQLSQAKQQVADQENVIALNDQLQQQVSELQNESDKLRQQNELLKDRFHSDVFYAGAFVLLVGMLISWILSRFSMKRRQRSGWR